MVAIVDPHVKRVDDYPVFKKARELGVFIKPASGEGEFEGWCWPGSSSWVDFFHPGSWNWWISLFQPNAKTDEFHWKESTDDLYIWNDMNEVCGLVLWGRRWFLRGFGSPLFSMDLRLRWRRVRFIMVDGSIGMSITSTACFSYVHLLFK